MQTAQNRLAIGHIAQRQRDMLLASVLVEKTMHGEHAERRRQLGSGDEHDRHGRKSQRQKSGHCNTNKRRISPESLPAKAPIVPLASLATGC